MIENLALVGPEPATRQRLHAMLTTSTASVYRIGRGAVPLPVTATFDPSDQPGSRSLLDWFEREVLDGRRDAVLVVDDWALCEEQDAGLDFVVQWIAAFGPRRGMRVVVTAREWDEIPRRVRTLVTRS
ncbi:hypothetical protein FKR81_08375 [Lentzea tibetensis]|uniref:Uncharacterized protein n=1 Tax=Lentzea tibetensis TaxID=2591470 RepID=A0A563EZE8_9PSEU|nr:hypothetical protein [Lentzea tibetensis]TWP53086.1 hypothetical protein FKR81_08375 [Lentzea tibetensis]